MGTINFSDDFKRDAVHQITVRGHSVREVSKRLAVSTHNCSQCIECRKVSNCEDLSRY